MRRIDLTGLVFGMLTVLGPAESQNGKTRWKCRCECGGETVRQTYSLIVSAAKEGISSCGCYTSALAKGRKYQSGEEHYAAVLTAEKVIHARELSKRGFGLREIMDHLGVRVDKATLSLAIRGKTWKNL